MNVKVETQDTKLDTAKWFLVGIIFVSSFVADCYVHVAAPIRVIGWIGVAIIAGLVAMQTVQGKLALTFARDARNEVRKVVWPTRQETVQTTLVVMFLVVIIAIFLWLIDSCLLWAIGWLTGQKG